MSGNAFASLDEPALQALTALFGDRITIGAASREQHGRGEAFHPIQAPDAVAFPADAGEVRAATKICHELHLPIIPFGAGTSLEGHVAATCGGLCLDLSRMNRILEVRPEDLLCRVEPGVTRAGLNSYLRDTGLHFPVDPGADATLGGMAATRASGTTTVRYGTMRENTLSLNVVLPDGRQIATARQARKTAAGYDLTHLFIGSEGTLGIITELTLKLHPVPEKIAICVVSFEELRSAVDTVIASMHMDIGVTRMELLDECQILACNRFSDLNLSERPTLFVEFTGTARFVEEQVELFIEVAAANGGASHSSFDPDGMRALWRARHDALPAAKALRPGSEVWVTDVCVPISRLTHCIVETREDLDRSAIPSTLLGHVGDGNFHVFLMIDPNIADELAEAERINDRLVDRAQAVNGTCTGEHGVGIGKIDKLEAELGPEAVDVMRSIKRAIDPAGIMNPGKIFLPQRRSH